MTSPYEWHTGSTRRLAQAITEFERTLPGWWWSIGSCSFSGHASCGPDPAGPDGHLLKLEDRTFDNGFHRDYITGCVTDALRDVMERALRAKQRLIKI
jgi:hypothetical protein